MLLRPVLSSAMALIVVSCIAASLWAANTKPQEHLFIYAGFEALPLSFLDRIGLDDRRDPTHGYYVLTNLEAFFLLDRKNQKATQNWPPKRNAATFGRVIRVTYRTDRSSDWSVLIRPSRADGGEFIQLTIESAKRSAFNFEGQVAVRLAPTDVVYIPCQTLLDNGKRRLYLVLKPVTQENGQ